MKFNTETRKLVSETGYIHALDDSLYTDYPIYLGKFDNSDNYEEGNEKDFIAWNEKQQATETEFKNSQFID